MKFRLSHLAMLGAILLCRSSVCFANERPGLNDPNRYLNAICEFADNVLKCGRDTYGPKHKPLFVERRSGEKTRFYWFISAKFHENVSVRIGCAGQYQQFFEKAKRGCERLQKNLDNSPSMGTLILSCCFVPACVDRPN